jgi:hypothetical protein
MRAVALASSDAGSAPFGAEEQESSKVATVARTPRRQWVIRLVYRLIARLRSSTVSSAARVSFGRWYDSASEG